MACFRDHSNKIKVVRNCLFHIMKLLLLKIMSKIRKWHLPKNKTTFFTYFLNGTLVSKEALFCTGDKALVQKSTFFLTLSPFKKFYEKSCCYIFKKK